MFSERVTGSTLSKAIWRWRATPWPLQAAAQMVGGAGVFVLRIPKIANPHVKNFDETNSNVTNSDVTNFIGWPALWALSLCAVANARKWTPQEFASRGPALLLKWQQQLSNQAYRHQVGHESGNSFSGQLKMWQRRLKGRAWKGNEEWHIWNGAELAQPQNELGFEPWSESERAEWLARWGGRALLPLELQAWLAVAGGHSWADENGHIPFAADQAVEQWAKAAIHSGSWGWRSTWRMQQGEWICVRCGSAADIRPAPMEATPLQLWLTPDVADWVCLSCLKLGRSSAHAALLTTGAIPQQIAQSAIICSIPQFTSLQQAAASKGVAFLRDPKQTGQSFLLWAVTGAGKTEMLFPLIAETLKQGQRVLLAAPRRDVILELAPRLAKAFPATRQAALYNGSTEQATAAELVLATTHQTMRFTKAFSLVIVDEVDAFPYHGDPRLAHAVQRARQANGRTIWVSATPSPDLIAAYRRGQLAGAVLPMRFHGHPLPVPTYRRTAPWAKQLHRGKLHTIIIQLLQQSLTRGAQLFVFVPRIDWVAPTVTALRTQLPGTPLAGTSSQDEERTAHVQSFRDREIRLLVTTTILERGVTIPHSDVFVAEADHPLFDSAALQQIAGRAGRSADDPHGRVLFFAAKHNRPQRQAIATIRQLNQQAQQLKAKQTDAPQSTATFLTNIADTITKTLHHIRPPRLHHSSPQKLCLSCARRSPQQRGRFPLFCKTCEQGIPWIRQIACQHCGRPDPCPDCVRLRRITKHRALRMNRAAVRYDAQARAWLHACKYHGETKWLPIFAEMLAQAVHQLIRDWGPEGGGLMPKGLRPTELARTAGLCAVTSVPINPSRHVERGFDAVEPLARAVAAQLGVPFVQVLARRLQTAKQSGKGRAERWRSLERAYGLLPGAELPRVAGDFSGEVDGAAGGLSQRQAGSLSEGQKGVLSSGATGNTSGGLRGSVLSGAAGVRRRIIVIDDLYTTGSTLERCALLLEELGVEVYSVTWARS